MIHIRKLETLERRTLLLVVGVGLVLFLFSLLLLIMFIIANKELQHLEKRSAAPVRVEKEIFDVAKYRCQGAVDYILVPRKGETYSFVCRDGDRLRDTVILTAAPRSDKAVDYALD